MDGRLRWNVGFSCAEPGALALCELGLAEALRFDGVVFFSRDFAERFVGAFAVGFEVVGIFEFVDGAFDVVDGERGVPDELFGLLEIFFGLFFGLFEEACEFVVGIFALELVEESRVCAPEFFDVALFGLDVVVCEFDASDFAF